MMNKKWTRGFLLAAALVGCQSGPDTDSKDVENSDIAEALAQLPEAEVLLRAPDGMPQYIVGDLGRVAGGSSTSLVADDSALRAAMGPLLKVFRLDAKDLLLRKVTTDDVGAKHYRYAQKFNGMDVVGGDLVVHLDSKGSIFAANGTARGDIPATMGAVAISQGAADLSVANDARWAGITGRAVTSSRLVYFQAQDGSLHKAYEQVVEGQKGLDPVKDKVFIDVESGSVVGVAPMIHFAKNRLTYSANNSTSLPGTQRRIEGQAPIGDTAVDQAHDNAGLTYDLYKVFFNRDSYNNAGATMKSSAHYSTNYCNAFWNSTQMVYGDGSGTCTNLTALDVVAHELTHAVTENESNLTYSGESGGLNESMSDIGGAVAEAFKNGGGTGPLVVNANTYLIGEATIPPFLRNMADPAADGSSHDVWSSGLGGVDVHYSSGPNNLAFVLLAKGGTHPRGKTTNMVPALGIDQAWRILHTANRDYLTSSSNYAAMRAAAESAATALGFDKDSVSCAYAAIKVGTAPAACGGTPPPPDGVLMNAVPVTGLSDSSVGNMKYWSLAVPSGQSTLTFTISGGTGDADMYVSAGTKPTETSYQCRPYVGGNSETCTFNAPASGTWYVGLRAYSAYTGVTLTGTYTGGGGGDPYLTNGTPVSNISGATGSAQYWRIAPGAGKTLTVTISGGTGDADLYVRAGSRPTTTTYNCRPYLSGNNETCTITSTVAGDYYIMLRGYSAFSGVTLKGTF